MDHWRNEIDGGTMRNELTEDEPIEGALVEDASVEDAIIEDEPIEDATIERELPPRPHRRLLGAGGNPIAVVLLGVLLCACGFIGGVLVEKEQTGTGDGGPNGASSGLASRLAALRDGARGGERSRGSGLSSAGGGASGGGSADGGAATIGQVAYVHGSTLYVTGFEGNTVKVVTSAGTDIVKTVKSSAHGVRPGETVIVTGTSDSSGTVHAQSVRAGEAGLGGIGGRGAGLGAVLFGGGGGASAQHSESSSGGGSARQSQSSGGDGGEGPVLFGK